MQVTHECERFRRSTGRAVDQTPKAFLRYLDAFKTLYADRLQEVDAESARVNAGIVIVAILH